MKLFITVFLLFLLQFSNCTHISCYKVNTDLVDNIETCDGWCVLKMKHYANETTAVTSGCQYRTSALLTLDDYELPDDNPIIGVLTDKDRKLGADVQPFTQINNKCHMNTSHIVAYHFMDGNESVDVEKICCQTAFCNDRYKREWPFKDYEDRKYDDAEAIFLISIACLMMIVSTIFPIVMAVKIVISSSEMSEEDYLQTIDPHLYEASEEIKVIDKDKIVTGQMNIEETATVLLEMIEGSDVSSVNSSSTDNQVIFNTPLMLAAGGHGHSLVRIARFRPFYLKSVLFRMIEHGPVEYPFKADELLEIFDEARDAFFSDPPLIHINNPVVIFGDLRGAYSDLHRWLQIVGWPPRTRLLFLGNVIDKNEPGSIDTLALVCCLKIAFPQEVFLLRGSCETVSYVPAGRFEHKIADALGGCISRMCNFLPAAAIVMDKILAVPSGISPLFTNLADVKDLDRPASLDEMKLIQSHLVFSLPSTKVRMYRPKDKSRGDYYGVTAVERIREQLGVSLIVRGSSPVAYGYLPSWNHTLVTLWSAPGKETQMGAVLVVSHRAEITPVLMKAQPSQSASYDKETRTKAMDKII